MSFDFETYWIQKYPQLETEIKFRRRSILELSAAKTWMQTDL